MSLSGASGKVLGPQLCVSAATAGEDHCSMDDEPPTDGMCHLRIRTPDG